MLGAVSVLPSSGELRASGPVMVLSGEADARSAGELREVLVSELWLGRRRLVTDIAGLRHVDSDSVRVLVVAAKMLRERRGKLVLLHPQPPVARMLELMGADQVITLTEPPETLATPVRPRSPTGYQQRHGRRPQASLFSRDPLSRRGILRAGGRPRPRRRTHHPPVGTAPGGGPTTGEFSRTGSIGSGQRHTAPVKDTKAGAGFILTARQCDVPGPGATAAGAGGRRRYSVI